jgi:hypothetical protein
MSYNGSGNWVTPTGQPVVTGTVIQSSTFNALVADIASTFNNVVTRDGQGPMTAPFKLLAGTVTIPGLSFNAESSTGLYWPSTGNLAFTASGVEVMRVNSGGRVLIGSTTDDGTTRLQVAGSQTISGSLAVTGVTTFTAGINNAPIGATTPSTGAFTTISATGLSSLKAIWSLLRALVASRSTTKRVRAGWN